MKSFLLLSFIVFIHTADVDVKDYLSRYGYYNPFAFDGGDGFTNAVKDFQKFHHLRVTGVVDDATNTEMSRPRCGLPDKLPGNKNAYYATRGRWRRKDLTYYFENLSKDLTNQRTKQEIRKAFDMWSAVTPLTFKEVTSRGNINIGWYVGSHGRGDSFPRGRGGILAHAYYPQDGRLHFDEDENWIVDCQGRGTDLLWVAVHEIGHAIGLQHSNVRGSIMWPSYFRCDKNLRLGPDDIKGIQSLYGKGSGLVPTTKDPTVTNGPTNPPGPCGENKDKRCTYWARDGWCKKDKVNQAMKDKCCKACQDHCKDNNSRCQEWANRSPSECEVNPNYMLRECRTSCKVCYL